MQPTTEVTRLIEQIEQRNYQHVIFDLDETLTQLQLPWQRWHDWLVEAVDPASRALFAQAMAETGHVPDALINQQIEQRAGFYDTLVTAAATFEQHYFAHRPYEALVAALPQLAQSGRQFYLWTNNTRPTAERALTEMGIADLFTTLVTRDSVRYGKPSQEGWRQIHDGQQLPEAYLFVGDSNNDSLAAKTAGTNFFRITHFH